MNEDTEREDAARAPRPSVLRVSVAIRLGTVAEAPTRACDLYAGAGFRVLKTFPRYRKPA